MKLVEDAKLILRKAWSIKFAILAAMFSAAEVALPYFGPYIPQGTMAILAAAASGGAILARVVVQQSISGPQP